MRRSDRRDDSYDNAVRHPHSRQPESVSPHELKRLLATARAQRDEAKDQAQEKEQQAEQNYQLYVEVQQQHQSAITLYQEEQQKYQTTLQLYEQAQTETQSYITLYKQEQTRSSELQVKYEEAQAESQRYLVLYNTAQSELKLERRSKAGIKSWETRRKRENERLKQEIAEMAVVLRDSLARKDEAVGHLEELANRMDRIQILVDIAEADTTSNPVGMLNKFRRIWQTIQDILAE
ncbi:MAG TPA: hypothetical protein V6D06_01975 [Trichocoleus sp.]